MTRMNIRGTNSARSAASRRGHGVVIVTSTTSEIDVATRMTIRPAAVNPCSVSPTRVPNQVPSGTTIVPWVMKLNVAGTTTIPVKIGMKSQTRLTKKRSDSRGHRQREARRVQRRRARGMLRTSAAVSRRTNIETTFTRGSSRCSSPSSRGDVVGEHALAHQVAAADRLLEEVALRPLADASARAETDLGPHEPVGSRRCRGRPVIAAGRRRSEPSRVSTATTISAITSMPTNADTM